MITLKLEAIWSYRQFSFWLWVNRISVWYIIKRKTVSMIIFLSVFYHCSNLADSLVGNVNNFCRIVSSQALQVRFPVPIANGPEVVFWGEVDIFADKGSTWFFDQIYLKIEEKTGEPYFRLSFWNSEPFKVKLSFTLTSSLKICIRSWCWLNIIELDIFLYQMKALFL